LVDLEITRGLLNLFTLPHNPYGQITQTTLNSGDNFTMSCSVKRTEAGLLYFYKMNLESLVQTVAEGSYEKITLKGNFLNSKFEIYETELNMEIVYTFTIFNVTREDAASYVCQAGSSYKMSFVNTTLLIILGKIFKFRSSVTCSFSSVNLGRPVQLQCSLVSKNSSTLQCPSKRNVHWFRSGAGESPGSIIYTYEEQTEEQNQRRCVYSLSTTIQDVNDTGMYYCAVATCGHVLFGPGTRVEISLAAARKGVCIVLLKILKPSKLCPSTDIVY
uniref:Ig-like domain-containing protein n=1 Tax=Periophthalmus magnuspinnatus TaxID=409849 RepID=A0A3B4B597_9GOBI